MLKCNAVLYKYKNNVKKEGKMEERMEWMVSGDCTEACTSPPVCPYYWGSSTPKDLHGGINQCEGAFTFHIKEGYSGEVDLSGLNVGFGFNTPVGGPAARDPWKAILYIDSRADSKQVAALEKIFKTCWSNMGDILKVKIVPISFEKEPVGNVSQPGYKHRVKWGNVYSLNTEPIMTMNGLPRYISGMMNGIIYIGKSTENKFEDYDLPRGNWDRPEMSNTYYEFSLNPSKLQWMP
jgi:hypothetical protein